MANVIKHKRGSGSDPVANDLVVGEVAIRTDVGKLFTKMDNGSVAEIAGGGSDIAINTLSSSSGTGGGSATFNGSAFRFTLSSPPSISAQQLLVSINGVIQKPVAGTGQPSEGFSVDGTDIILGDAPETGADFFILTFKSLGVSEPADNSVTSAKIVDGAIVNADINASAAIAGTKISPDFGSQNIVTTGSITGNDLEIDSGTLSVDASNNRVGINTTSPTAPLTVHNTDDSNLNVFEVYNDNGNNSGGFSQNSAGDGTIFAKKNDGTLNVFLRSNGVSFINGGSCGIGTTSPTTRFTIVQSADNNTGGLSIFDSTNNSSFRIYRTGAGADSIVSLQDRGSDVINIKNQQVGIGTTSPNAELEVAGSSVRIRSTANSSDGLLDFYGQNTSNGAIIRSFGSDGSAGHFHFRNANNSAMTIDSSGQVGIGTSSPTSSLHVSVGSSGTNSSAGFNEFCIEGGNEDIGMCFLSPAANNRTHTIAFGDSNNNAAGKIQYNHSTDDLTLTASDNIIFTGDAVGIGVTSPLSNSVLHVKSSNAADYRPLVVEGSATNGSGIAIHNSGAQRIFIGSGGGNNLSGSSTSDGVIRTETNTVFAVGNSEKVRIDSSGQVGINTTSPSAALHIVSGGANLKLSRSSFDDFQIGIGTVGGVNGLHINNQTDNFTALSISEDGHIFAPNLNSGSGHSDLRYVTSTGQIIFDSSTRLVKTDIQDCSYGLAQIQQLKPRIYKRTDADNVVEIGLIADEVQGVLPEIVATEQKSFFTKNESDTEIIPSNVDLKRLTVVLINAIQELTTRIEALEAK